MKKLLIFTLLLSVLFKALGQDGKPDSSFGKNGRIVEELFRTGNVFNEEPRQLLIQPDDKIVGILNISSFGFQPSRTVLVRHLANTNLDRSFGIDGFADVNFTSAKARLQPDGKIIMAGSVFSNVSFTSNDFVVARFTKDGLPDENFGTKGRVVTDFGAEDETATSIAVLSNGKILVCGYTYNGSYYDFAIARLNSDGSLDNSFNGNGKLTINFGNKDYRFNDIIFQSDEKIVLGGYSKEDGSNNNMAIARLNSDGSIDPSFGNNGWQTSNLATNITSITLQPDGKIITLTDLIIARFLVDGNMDLSYGKDGKINFTSINGGGVALQKDGKLVAVNGYPWITVSRFTPNGLLDLTFGINGILRYEFGNYDYGTALGIQSDGNIIAGGRTKFGNDLVYPKYDYRLLSYNSNGILNTVRVGYYPVPQNSFKKMVVQADGKIVVAGITTLTLMAGLSVIENVFLARYNADGSLDKTFSEDGKLNIPVPTAPRFLSLQKDGKILLYASQLYRFSSDGSPDNSFGVNGILDLPFAEQMAVQSGDKIIIAATTPSKENALYRYNNDGSIDNAFGNAGIQLIEFAGKLVVQPDDKILVSATSITENNKLDLVRYLTNGGFDNSFDGDGKATITFDFPFREKALSLDKEGRIIIAGALDAKIALIRINVNGSLDKSFGIDGKIVTDFVANGYENALSIQRDGKIILIGQNSNNSEAYFSIARYNANGTLDNSFDGEGTVNNHFGHWEYFGEMSIYKNRLLVAGTSVSFFPPGYDTSIGFLASYQLGLQKPSVNIVDVLNYESDDWVNLPVTLSQPLNTNLVLHYETIDSTASHYNNDYGREIGAVMIPAGQISTNLRLKINNDNLAEPAEYFKVKLSLIFAPKDLVVLEKGTAIVTILDGLYPLKPFVSISDVAVQEPEGWVNLPVTLSQALNTNLVLHYETIDSTASHYNNDYRREIGAVMIPAGQISTNLRLKINNDNLAEPAEYFKVKLSLIFAPKDGVVLEKGTALVTILDGNFNPKSIARLATNAAQQKTSLYSIRSYPNPSSNFFNIELQGSHGQPISIIVNDAQGRTIEVLSNVSNKNLIQLGSSYRPGIYYAQILQATNKQVIKLVKLTP